MVCSKYRRTSWALLELEPFTITGDAPTLGFWHKYNTEPAFDGGYISISTDELNFEDLGPNILGHYRGVSQHLHWGKDSFGVIVMDLQIHWLI